MRQRRAAWALSYLLAALFLPGAGWAADLLPPDAAVEIAGTQAVCTGVSLDSRRDPRWSNFPLKIELAAAGGRYVGGEEVTVRKSGAAILTVTCGGPWLLLGLPPGRYEVSATLEGQTARSAAFVPNHGQGRIILRFGDIP